MGLVTLVCARLLHTPTLAIESNSPAASEQQNGYIIGENSKTRKKCFLFPAATLPRLEPVVQ